MQEARQYGVSIVDKPLTWAEVDLKAYAHNIKELRRISQPKARLMAVVKANGYGHGATEVAREALQNGAEWLGVARINEAIQLRKVGFAEPILILGYTPPDLTDKLIEFDLTQTVYSYSTAEILSSKAQSSGKTIRIHIKVDSGMGRLGILPQALVSLSTSQDSKSDPVREIESIAKLAGLEIEGIFTHFATADSADKSYANKQLDIFLDFLNRLRQAGLDFPIKHAANSAALIDLPQSHLDMVRPGIATYGLYPSAEVNKKGATLKPVMALKSRIIHLKQVPAGFNVSYGITYQTEKPTIIASVPVGYADGLNRLLSSCGDMLVHGQRVPIIGRVCMDLTMLDVGDLSSVDLEDEVVVFGQQGDESITADDIASRLNTINYEVVSSIMARVPRIYLEA
jgi:alanine racemase